MTQVKYGEFISNILQTLKKNGYPDKKVALPLDRTYEIAYEKDLNLNKVLEFLLEQGVAHEKTTAKIIFFPVDSSTKPQESAWPIEESVRGRSNDDRPLDVEGSPAFDRSSGPETMLGQAMEMIRKMSPDQLRSMEKMVTDMSEDERQLLFNKAKDLGFDLPKI